MLLGHGVRRPDLSRLHLDSRFATEDIRPVPLAFFRVRGAFRATGSVRRREGTGYLAGPVTDHAALLNEAEIALAVCDYDEDDTFAEVLEGLRHMRSVARALIDALRTYEV